MTCIIGLVSDGSVHLLGDRSAVQGHALDITANSKVFKNGDFVIGYTSSFRMGQVLQYAFNPPTPTENCDLMRFMVVQFIPALQASLEQAGVVNLNDGVKSCGTFLVGYRDRLFEICDDFQVFESMNGFAAIGSGALVALGAMSVLVDGKNNPAQIMTTAMTLSQKFTTTVAEPFDLVRTEPARECVDNAPMGDV